MARGLSGETTWRRSRIVVPVASPAAGTDWSLTVPAGHRYDILAVFGVLTTSAVAATRVACLTFGDGPETYLSVPPATSQVTGLVRRYAFAPGAPVVATGTRILSFLPDLSLPAGWTLGSVTEAIDVGDQWSGLYVHVADTTVRDGSIDLDALPDLIVEVVESAPPTP